MNPKYPSPLAIFPDEATNTIESKNDEFYTWTILHNLIYHDDFREEGVDSVISYYSPVKNVDDFLDRQPLDEISNESFWNTENDLAVYNNSLYHLIRNDNDIPILWHLMTVLIAIGMVSG